MTVTYSSSLPEAKRAPVARPEELAALRRIELAAAKPFGETAVRIVGLRDKAYDARMAWLQSWLPSPDTHVFSEDDTQVLSQVHAEFEVLVLHGADPDRMARILRDWRRVLTSKIIVAMPSPGNQPKHSALLNAGADAVIEVDTETPVAAAWLQSLISRTAAFRAASRSVQQTVDTVAMKARATPLQRRLLAHLIANAGPVVPYADLLRALDKGNGDRGVRALHVAICNLRKKLPTSIRIVNIHGIGYQTSISA